MVAHFQLGTKENKFKLPYQTIPFLQHNRPANCELFFFTNYHYLFKIGRSGYFTHPLSHRPLMFRLMYDRRKDNI
jgi:hypothetical protein